MSWPSWKASLEQEKQHPSPSEAFNATNVYSIDGCWYPKCRNALQCPAVPPVVPKEQGKRGGKEKIGETIKNEKEMNKKDPSHVAWVSQ
jgi:hypothetical protein